MKYQQKKFQLPAVERPPERCEHGWVNPDKGTCVMCGAVVREPAKDAA